MKLFNKKTRQDAASTAESTDKKSLSKRQISLYSTGAVVIVGGGAFLAYTLLSNQPIEQPTKPIVTQEQQKPELTANQKAELYDDMLDATLRSEAEAFKHHPYVAGEQDWIDWNQEMIKTKQLAQKLREKRMEGVLSKHDATFEQADEVWADGSGNSQWNTTMDDSDESGDYYVRAGLDAFMEGGDENMVTAYRNLRVAAALGNDIGKGLLAKIEPALSEEQMDEAKKFVANTLESMNADPEQVAEQEEEEEESEEDEQTDEEKKVALSHGTKKSWAPAKNTSYAASVMEVDADEGMGGEPSENVPSTNIHTEPSWLVVGKTKEERAFDVGYQEGYLDGHVEGSVRGYDLGYDDGFEGREKRDVDEIVEESIPDDAPEVPRGHYREVMRDMSDYTRREIWERNRQSVNQ